MIGNLSMRKVLTSVCMLTLAATVSIGMARDINDDAPFGPGGAEYRIPDPTPMFLLQAPLKTDLTRENLLNAVPASAEVLVYSSNMSQMHDNFAKTVVGKLSESKKVGGFFAKLVKCYEEDFSNGDGSYSNAQVEERRLEWKMYQDFYNSAAHELAVFVYWTRGREEPNYVMIAASNTGNELNDSAGVLREYFNKRREINSHLSVVDRTHKTRKSANSIKQINSDQTLIQQEAYCVRNNLVIYAKGTSCIDDVLDRLDNPEQSIAAKAGGRFDLMREKTSINAETPPDILIAVRMNSEIVKRLPEDLRANVGLLVAAAPNQEISAAAGLHFDPKSGKIHERVFVATGAPAENPAAAAGKKHSGVNSFLTARLLDPARTVVYASTAGDVNAWKDVFVRERLFGGGVPRWLTMDSAKEALGGEMAIAFYSRDRSPETSDYLRMVVILEEANPKDHTKLDAWKLDVKNSCGEGFAHEPVPIPVVGKLSIIHQNLINPNDKSTENLGRAGFEALVNRNAANSMLSFEQARAPLNFFPCYSEITLTDEQGLVHNYVVCSYSVAVLRQVLTNMKQASNLASTLAFRERVNQFAANFPGVTVYLNTDTALRFMREDLLNVNSDMAKEMALGNVAVKDSMLMYAAVADDLSRVAESSAFKGYRIPGGYLIEGSSNFGHLAPLGLIQSYSQLTLRKKEYERHAANTRAKMQAIKVALDLYFTETGGRYPTRDALPELKQFLKTDEYSDDDREFNQKQTAEFLRIFCFLPGNALLADVEQAKQPQNSNLVYVEGMDERSQGDAVLLYEARPSATGGEFFCLHRDGRIDTLKASALAALLPPPDKIHNPYSPALVRALEVAAEKK